MYPKEIYKILRVLISLCPSHDTILLFNCESLITDYEKLSLRKEIRSSRKWKIILLSLLLEDKTSRFDHHLQRLGDVPAQLLKFFSLIMQMQISRRPVKVHDLSYPQLASASRWKISAKDWWKIHGAIFVARLCKQ